MIERNILPIRLLLAGYAIYILGATHSNKEVRSGPTNQSGCESSMVLFLCIAVTMFAFAGNSILTRLALADETIDPGSFALTRLLSGAVFLLVFTFWQKQSAQLWGPKRIEGMLSLSLYIIGFTYAYTKLDTGVGALIFFGVVQIVMFAAASFSAETIPKHRVTGALIAFAGLVYLLWPSDTVTINFSAVLAMVLAGIGWGAYSIVGRNAGPALPATAASFSLALPICFIIIWALSEADQTVLSNYGATLAVFSGVITSAMGYAIWYRVLPQITSSIAAVSQLTVPALAMTGGILLLNEVPTLKFLVASALVLGGVAIALGLHRTMASE